MKVFTPGSMTLSAQDYYTRINQLQKWVNETYLYEIGQKEQRQSQNGQRRFIEDSLDTIAEQVQTYKSDIKHGKTKAYNPRFMDLRKSLCLEAPPADRRKQVILDALKTRGKQYAEEYPDIDTNKIFMDLQSFTISSPNVTDKFAGLLLSVALYIADFAFVTGQYNDLLFILDQYKVPEWRDTLFINKSYTSKAVIMKILTLLYCRNVPGSIVQTPPDNALMMDVRASQRTLSYKGNPKETSEYREALNKILELISDEDKEHCEKAFTEEAIRFEAIVMRRYAEQYRQLWKDLTKVWTDVKQSAEKMKNKSPKEMRTPPQLSLLMPKPALDAAINNIVRERFTGLPTATDVISLYNRIDAVMKTSFSLSNSIRFRGTPKSHMKKAANGDSSLYETMIEEWYELSEDENPYDICFGFFLLLDKGDDLPWLFGTVNPIITKACDRLPWGVKGAHRWNDEDIDEIILNEEEDLEETGVLYEECYGEKDQKENLQQLLYRKTGMIVSPRLFVKPTERQELLEEGLSDEAVPFFMLLKHMANELYRLEASRHKIEKDTEDTPATEDAVAEEVPEATDEETEQPTETEEDLRNTIQAQKKEIERLKRQSYDSRKEADAEKQRADSAMLEKETQRKELADLREIVFRMNNNIPEEEDTPEEEKIEFPYETVGKVVVFGGHDTWSKAIRPMLPNVRFVERAVNPSEQLIKNADEIWVQTNAMSHSMYNKIMSIARMQNIPIRYFTSASAERCARKLAAENQKHH